MRYTPIYPLYILYKIRSRDYLTGARKSFLHTLQCSALYASVSLSL